MPWETYRRTSRPSPKSPTVTLSKNGMLGLNTAVIGLLGNRRFALLMFDRKKYLIGIKLLKENEPDAYPIGVVPAKSHGSISGVGFLKAYGIMPEKTQAFPALFDEKSNTIIADVSSMKPGGKKAGEIEKAVGSQTELPTA